MTENKKGSSSDDSHMFENTPGHCLDDVLTYDDSYFAIPANMHKMMLQDIDNQELKSLGDQTGIVNLSPAVFPRNSFPVDNGVITSLNNRLMVCLVCRGVRIPAATINVWFVVITGSNATFLAKDTIKALIPDEKDPVPSCLRVSIQDPESVIECHLSGEHFEEANVLGMHALLKLKLWIDLNWENDRFRLCRK